MMVQHPVGRSDDLDVATMARRKIGVFGTDAGSILVARAEHYRRDGNIETAKFWQAVADAVAAADRIDDPRRDIPERSDEEPSNGDRRRLGHIGSRNDCPDRAAVQQSDHRHERRKRRIRSQPRV